MRFVLAIVLGGCALIASPAEVIRQAGGPHAYCNPVNQDVWQCEDDYGDRWKCVNDAGRWTCWRFWW